MSSTKTMKCPSCGAYLEYDPASAKLTCPYCGMETIVPPSEEEPASSPNAADVSPDSAAETVPLKKAAKTPNMVEYHCQNCGAEIVTTATTAATRCYYCHSPVVLTDRLSAEFHPDGVIPFAINEEKAKQQFNEFIDGKIFVDRRFFTPDQLTYFSGVYYPYWYGEITGVGRFEGRGTRVNVVHTPKETITTTKYYEVAREGRMIFTALVRKALSGNDRKLSDGIFPYSNDKIRPFSEGYLSGFLAEKRDVPQADAEKDMIVEVSEHAQGQLTADAGYNSIKGKTTFRSEKAVMRYVLLPTWVLTYKGDKKGKTYFYMMNGQKGTVCGKLPINKGKLALWAAGMFAAVTGLMCLGGALLW